MFETELKTLNDERIQLVSEGRRMLETQQKEKREMNAQESSAWDRICTRVDAIEKRMDGIKKLKRADDDSKEDEDDEREDDDKDKEDEDRDDEDKKDDDDERSYVRLPDGRVAIPVGEGKRNDPKRPRPNSDARNTAATKPFPGESRGDFETRQRRNSNVYRDAAFQWLVTGMSGLTNKQARAIQADTDISGGYLVMPQQFVATLIKFVDNLLFIREKATKYVVANAQTLGAPSLDNDPADSDWTSELATGTEDTTMSFGKRELTPHPLAKRLKVSNKLLRQASIQGTFSNYDAAGTGAGGVEGLVRARLGYKFRVSEEKGFLTGNGAQQPLGLFTASTRGISTARDVLTGSSTGFTPDQLIAAKYTLKQQYWDKSEWLFHRDALKLIRQLKDAVGQYLWAPGTPFDRSKPDTFLDRPVNMSEYVPNTFTTGLYVGMLGDFSFYWIVDSLALQIQRLVELYAEANQTGFIARMELDGMPVLEEAFVRLKTN
jgi:HK97 family phage major capsid protein